MQDLTPTPAAEPKAKTLYAFFRGLFSRMAIGQCVHAALCVAIGAAIQGGVLSGSVTDVLLLDKTGTITVGAPRVTDLYPAPGFTPQQLLQQPRKKLHSRNRKIRQYMMKTVTKLMLQKQQKTEILYMTKMETRLIRARLQQKQLQKTVEAVM